MSQLRTLPVTFFVVDDVKEEAETYSATLRQRMNDVAAAFSLSHGLRITVDVVALYPNANEFADEFLARFERVLGLTDDETRDQALRAQGVFFDLSFQLSSRAGESAVDGYVFAEACKRLRPNIARYGLTSKPATEALQDKNLVIKSPVFEKRQLHLRSSATNVCKEVLTDLEQRFATPLWDSLIQFSKLKKIPMHAMASTEARQAELTVAVDPFLNFMGDHYQIEASSTKFPLDSLLGPKASIKSSQEKVAKTFGARDCIFVTNGTSGANSIVHNSVCSEDDYVLLDRACHISHHTSLMTTGAFSIYLESGDTEISGVPGQILLDDYVSKLRLLLSSGNVPRLVSISNCTFDGILFDPQVLIEKTLEVYAEFGKDTEIYKTYFLFDEAWFSFGYFHPEYCRFSSMFVAEQLKSSSDHGDFWTKNLNVFATQSLHKTGFALRQGAVILASIGEFAEDSCRENLRQAQKMFTTTSPSMPILASLEWAAVQLDLEGCFLVERSHAAASVIQSLYDDQLETRGMHFAQKQQLLPGGPYNQAIDRTKVTLRSENLSGKKMREDLWALNDYKVQVNKFSSDSVLLMFMPGFTDQSIAKLRMAFDELLNETVETPSKPKLPPSLPRLENMQFLGSAGDPIKLSTALKDGDGLKQRRALVSRFRVEPELIPITDDTLELCNSEKIYSLYHVTPYPPGFPILVPTQRVTAEHIEYLMGLDHGEIHGLSETRGGRFLVSYRM